MGQALNLEEFKTYVESPDGPLSHMDQASAEALLEMLRIASTDSRPADEALIDELENLIAIAANAKKDGVQS